MLKELQQKIIESILLKTPIKEITPMTKLSVNLSLETYHKDYFARLSEALYETYSTICMVLGDEDFLDCCNGYILKHPSQDYDLNLYGEYFSKYISCATHQIDFPFLSELADYEWQFMETFHAKESELNIDLKTHSMKDLEQIELNITKSAKILTYQYPVNLIRENRERGPDQNWFNKSAYYLILYKYNHKIYYQTVSESQYNLLININGITPLNELVQKCQLSPQELQNLMSFLVSKKIIYSNS